MPTMDRRTHRFAPIATLTALLIAFPIAAGGAHAGPRADDALAREQIRFAVNLSEAFKSVAREVRPSVVHITTWVEPSEDEAEEQGGFFRGRRSNRPRQIGMGSGVVVRADGYVVTNNHVVANGDRIEVRLEDQSLYPATVVGTDPESDLAVLRIEADGLKPLAFGDARTVEPGEWVLAVGSPFGLSQSVSAGIVSAVGRADLGLTVYEDFIQTDATINPGNSGGPLVNLYGELVGVNTAISTRTGASQGIGFAIPARMVKEIVASLVESGHVVRGWLGVRVVPLTPSLAQRFDFAGTQGVIVVPVSDTESPAGAAGLEEGDVVVRIDGRSIADRNDLLTIVASIRPGMTVPIDVVRYGEAKSFDVTIGERPAVGAP